MTLNDMRAAQLLSLLLCTAWLAGTHAHAARSTVTAAEQQIQAEALAELNAQAMRRAELRRQWAQRDHDCRNAFATTACLNRLEQDRRQHEHELGSVEAAARATLRESQARDRIHASIERGSALERREAARRQRAPQLQQANQQREANAQRRLGDTAQRRADEQAHQRAYQAKLERHLQAARDRARLAAERQPRTAAGDSDGATRTQ